MSYCEAKYEGFLKDLGVWLDPGANTEDKAFAHIQKEKLKRVDWGEVAVIAGITVVSTGICILCPPATPWVIAGGVAAGALAEGGMEVYKESKTGEYDWVKILTKTLGGGLKGALAASPLKPLATGVGVATTGAIEDYIYCIANGETHEQALKSAAINGPIEGLTVGGCKWLGNAVASKVKVDQTAKFSKPTQTTGLKPSLQQFAKKGDCYSHKQNLDGLNEVINHLTKDVDGLEFDPNKEMINKLKEMLLNNQELTGAYKDFYEHELTESILMKQGYNYNDAHNMALEIHKVKPQALYSSEIVQKFYKWFNKGDYEYWGITIKK